MPPPVLMLATPTKASGPRAVGVSLLPRTLTDLSAPDAHASKRREGVDPSGPTTKVSRLADARRIVITRIVVLYQESRG
jgi:hypothetical protein